MLDYQFQILSSVELVHGEPICCADPRGQRIERVEAHPLQGAPAPGELEPEVLVADHALALHLEVVAKERLRKPLAPHLVIEEPRETELEVRWLERPIGLDRAGELCRRQKLASHGLEAGREALEVRFPQSQARRRGVAAKAQ